MMMKCNVFVYRLQLIEEHLKRLPAITLQVRYLSFIVFTEDVCNL